MFGRRFGGRAEGDGLVTLQGLSVHDAPSRMRGQRTGGVRARLLPKAGNLADRKADWGRDEWQGPGLADRLVRTVQVRTARALAFARRRELAGGPRTSGRGRGAV